MTKKFDVRPIQYALNHITEDFGKGLFHGAVFSAIVSYNEELYRAIESRDRNNDDISVCFYLKDGLIMFGYQMYNITPEQDRNFVEAYTDSMFTWIEYQWKNNSTYPAAFITDFRDAAHSYFLKNVKMETNEQ